MDGKIKAPPSAGRKGLVGLEILDILAMRPAGVFARNSNEFNAPTAIPRFGAPRSGHDQTGRRLQSSTRPYPPRRPGGQASEELCRRGDAGREEGGPSRSRVQRKRRVRGSLDLRPGTAGGAVARVPLLVSAPRGHGPDRPPTRRRLPLGAALETCRLSETRGRLPRRRGRPDVGRRLRRRRREGLR